MSTAARGARPVALTRPAVPILPGRPRASTTAGIPGPGSRAGRRGWLAPVGLPDHAAGECPRRPRPPTGSRPGRRPRGTPLPPTAPVADPRMTIPGATGCHGLGRLPWRQPGGSHGRCTRDAACGRPQPAGGENQGRTRRGKLRNTVGHFFSRPVSARPGRRPDPDPPRRVGGIFPADAPPGQGHAGCTPVRGEARQAKSAGATASRRRQSAADGGPRDATSADGLRRRWTSWPRRAAGRYGVRQTAGSRMVPGDRGPGPQAGASERFSIDVVRPPYSARVTRRAGAGNGSEPMEAARAVEYTC
jgi:hypothetical protein